jgi:hypothetical protein
MKTSEVSDEMTSRPTEFLLRPMEFFFCWSRRDIATNRIFAVTNGIFAVTNGIFAVTNGICTGGGTRYKQRARKWVYFGGAQWAGTPLGSNANIQMWVEDV